MVFWSVLTIASVSSLNVPPREGADSSASVEAWSTTTLKLLVADICGVPLSVTMTERVLVLGACAAEGVQLKRPPLVMLALVGAPAPRLKVRVWGGWSVSAALAVKVSRVLA
jgi:hypothetical protein